MESFPQFSCLPHDIRQLIFMPLLPRGDLINFCQFNKHYHTLGQELWRKYLSRDFNLTYPGPKPQYLYLMCSKNRGKYKNLNTFRVSHCMRAFDRLATALRWPLEISTLSVDNLYLECRCELENNTKVLFCYERYPLSISEIVLSRGRKRIRINLNTPTTDALLTLIVKTLHNYSKPKSWKSSIADPIFIIAFNPARPLINYFTPSSFDNCDMYGLTDNKTFSIATKKTGWVLCSIL